jgi:hypothetical protein
MGLGCLEKEPTHIKNSEYVYTYTRGGYKPCTQNKIWKTVDLDVTKMKIGVFGVFGEEPH